MSRFFVTPDDPEGWKEGLASPTHWRAGYSAHSLAYTWHRADGFPPRVEDALAKSDLGRLELVAGIPEYKVALPGGNTASQTDLFVLARTSDGRRKVAIAVEGKAEEEFGDSTVVEWRIEPSDGKKLRLSHLLRVLGLSDDDSIGPLRYQLIHRTASALMEAGRLHAPVAVMLVHSFSPTRRWRGDLADFVSALASDLPEEDAIVYCGDRHGRQLYVGWVGDERPEVDS